MAAVITPRTAPGMKWQVGLLLALVLALSGCSTAGYYAQSIQGHLALMRAARPIDDWLRDPAAPAQLRQRLTQARQMRAFAVRELGLPDNASYHDYADLGRRAAVWSVAAAPPDSLVLHRWCFPVVGCVGYRGYYDEAEARAFARRVAETEGLEVVVYPVPAYSTLGWLNWAGGDPLLSTFIGYPEGELARILFHELAHQQVYLRGDTRFNESYASAVARLGVARWLDQRTDAAVRRDYEAFDQRRQAFRELARQTRAELTRLYEEPGDPGAAVAATLAARKAETMARFRARYAALKADWAAAGTPYEGFDPWVAQANNASFGLQAAYDGLVPAFEALFEREGADWPRFHAAVRALAHLPRAERDRQLEALASAGLARAGS
jgi:predicted aminopeptidase